MKPPEDSRTFLIRKLHCEKCNRSEKWLGETHIDEDDDWPECCGERMKVKDKLPMPKSGIFTGLS